jgi:gluconate 5-dehydrogenase
MSTLFDVKGKIVLITGSSRGLGLILARGLGREGAKVVLNGRDAERLELARKELEAEGFEVYASCFDIVDSSATNEAVKKIEKEIGPIDVLVNNAGIQYRAPLEEFPEEEWRRILDINLTGVFIVSKAVVQGMKARGRGKIINICSLQSDLGRATIAPYAASKGGVKMLTRGMTVDWAKYGIQINGIGPGYFVTKMTQPLKDDEKFDTWICGRTPAGRWGDPEELIGALLFFSSSASDFINGQLLYVDGGITAAI